MIAEYSVELNPRVKTRKFKDVFPTLDLNIAPNSNLGSKNIWNLSFNRFIQLQHILIKNLFFLEEF